MTSSSSIEFSHYQFEDLSLNDLYNVLKLRSMVFNHQQRLIEISDGKCIEIDDKDSNCIHIIGKLPNQQIVATARLFDKQSLQQSGEYQLIDPPPFRKIGLRI